MSDTAPPTMRSIDAAQALATLDHPEMLVLAQMFERWAVTEPKIDRDRRAELLRWAADYAALADWAGPQWIAAAPDPKPDAIKFMAQQELQFRGG